jgi:AraC-like DNA-binding protein
MVRHHARMGHQDSRAAYAERMHRVLAHIDEHIDQPLDLPRLAKVAHFSAFHFQRLFAAWMGETLSDYRALPMARHPPVGAELVEAP